MRKTKYNPYYLDVAQYILSGPFSPKLSPAFAPVEHQIPEHLTPLSKPLYVQINQGQHSPYLKELLSKVQSNQIEFWDFTLDGQDASQNDQQYIQQQINQEMSVIEEQSSEHQNQDSPKENALYEFNPQQYVPNMHLLELDLSHLKIDFFEITLSKIRKTINSQEQDFNEQMRQFISIYLTDDDLDTYKNSTNHELIQRARKNLSFIGNITKLERKSKVSRYLQKKKKRIWKKKVNYDCRKKVADNRLRLKGKFVTREQACVMLGIELCSQEQLKQIIRTKYSKMIF